MTVALSCGFFFVSFNADHSVNHVIFCGGSLLLVSNLLQLSSDGDIFFRSINNE